MNSPSVTRTADLIKAKKQQCYYNAFRVIMEVPGYEQADYVEGFVVNDKGLFFEHGWVEREGIVIDPTFPRDDRRYIPGLRFRGASGLGEAMMTIPKPEQTKEDLPIFFQYGWGGKDHPEFDKARAEAVALVFGKPLTKQNEDQTGENHEQAMVRR